MLKTNILKPRFRDKIMPSHLVTKSNSLINSTYRLSLHEIRVVLFVISLVDPRELELKEFYSFKISELTDFFKLPKTSAYKEIKEAVLEKLWGREISYWEEQIGHIAKIRWVDKVTYSPEEGEFRLRFNQDLKPFLQQLKGNFTTYRLKNIGTLNSVYGVRIFELCVMRLGKKQNNVCFQYPIDQLKAQFGLSDRYDRFYDFRINVLEKAKKEINKHTEIKIKYTVVKKGRKPELVSFSVERKEHIVTKLSKEDIRKLALPGETWGQAKKRLARKKEGGIER